ncbi:MAG: CoA pyrophosphatase [Bacteroidetes bacterium]|nr:CoA pyrophosphatase [Bacteroidota bacterium]
MFINKIITELKLELLKDLPSNKAHQRMMPKNRILVSYDDITTEIPKLSSVLILLYPKNNQLFTVFIKRQEYEGVHSGQIAFPGGKYEEKDINLINTALREGNEEIGIDVSAIEILGKLSELFIPRSNFMVLPVIGYTPVPQLFTINHKEVNKVIEVSLEELLSPNNISENEFIVIGNKKIIAPCYVFGNHKVWGATAMIVSELIEVLKASDKSVI